MVTPDEEGERLILRNEDRMKPRIGEARLAADGEYSFSLYDEGGRLAASFTYFTKEAAEAAAEHFRLGIADCKQVHNQMH